MTLHYAAGGDLDDQGNFAPSVAGMNLADVQYLDQVNALPDGVKALVWLDQAQGVTQDFINEVSQFIGNDKVYGFYLADEPDPTGIYHPLATAADLKAESDWIHSHDPGAFTFITMMQFGSSAVPTYENTYTPDNTHIDYFGIDPYPVRSDGVDFNMIDEHVAAAEAAGIPQDQIIPVYQTFGGGDWMTDTDSKYVVPTVTQEQIMFDHWDALVPNPAFDYAYAWGSQANDTALESLPGLQALFLQHNTAGGSEPPQPPPPPPVPEPPPTPDPPPIEHHDWGWHFAC
jgi:hypothetical protein